MTTREHDDLLQTHHLRIEEEEKVGGWRRGRSGKCKNVQTAT